MIGHTSFLRQRWPARHDPWWDLEGRGVRRRRRSRLVLRLLLDVAMAVLTAAGGLIAIGAIPLRAAGLTVNLDQWASTEAAWQNGNVNGNNSQYPEGGIVPFRLAIENLAPGSHSIHINYDFTAGGHKAYDFLATWNATNSPDICSAGGGAVSSMCPFLPAALSSTFPSDGLSANGLSVSGAQVYSGAPRRLTIWGGAVTGITGPAHDGSVDGNSTGDFTVTFESTGSAVLLAWGGHLAQSAYWDLAAGGPRDGAGEVSGAPWHMRTLQLDGTGNKNQDRSIQPSAIVGELPPFALTPTPPPTLPPAPAPAPPTSAPAPPAPPTSVPTPPTTALVPGPTPDPAAPAPIAPAGSPTPAAPAAPAAPATPARFVPTIPPTDRLSASEPSVAPPPGAVGAMVLGWAVGVALLLGRSRSRRRAATGR